MNAKYKFNLIAFDFDGVIVDSLAQNIKITNEVCGKYGAEIEVTKNLLQSVDCMSFDSIATKIKLPLNNFKIALQEINDKLVASYDTLMPFDGIFDTLKNLYDVDIEMIINTHNTVHAVDAFLRKHNMLYFFSDILGAETPGDKSEKMFLALENSQLCSCNAMLIGDSVSDIKNALTAGVKPAGVSWGFQNPEKLQAAGADIIFETPSDISEFIIKHCDAEI